jgi:hypothetical protein
LAFDLSPDKQAFTATFDGFEAITGQNSPIVGRTFSFSLPLSDAAPSMEIPFFVQGFVLCQKGSDGHLVLIINDQTTVVDFPEGSDTSFLHKTNFKVGSASELFMYSSMAPSCSM